jgi:hypothetical protein
MKLPDVIVVEYLSGFVNFNSDLSVKIMENSSFIPQKNAQM